jgi:hypothetical protein
MEVLLLSIIPPWLNLPAPRVLHALVPKLVFLLLYQTDFGPLSHEPRINYDCLLQFTQDDSNVALQRNWPDSKVGILTRASEQFHPDASPTMNKIKTSRKRMKNSRHRVDITSSTGRHAGIKNLALSPPFVRTSESACWWFAPWSWSSIVKYFQNVTVCQMLKQQ